MIFYKELNLPHPIINNKQFVKMHGLKKPGEYDTIVTDVQTYLHPDLLHAFESINVKPQWFASFGFLKRSVASTYIHTDLTFDKEWVTIPFGINWELTAGVTEWSWWDVTGSEAVYPTLDISEDSRRRSSDPFLLNGIHHESRLNTDTSKFKLLNSYTVIPNQPVLFRTDVPHQINYNTTHKQRICMSLRFSISDIPSWDLALKIFQPFFKK